MTGYFGERLQSLGIAHLKILDLYLGFTREHGAGGAANSIGRAFPRVELRTRSVESAVQSGRNAPLIWRQELIARTECQTVVFAHRGDTDNLDGYIEITHHAANDSELLCVLFAKVRALGGDKIQKLQDYCRDTAKVAGAVGAAQMFSQHRRVYEGQRLLRIDLRSRGREYQIDTVLGANFQIAFEGTGIARKILLLVKLQRIDKDGRNNEVVFAPRPIEESGVTGV
ncbi:MAG TPA: hypothetical protein VHY79_00950 [Rhizomicrobium sp.]|nr:hypothetical protein [Rhizomicrobium sp.]